LEESPAKGGCRKTLQTSEMPDTRGEICRGLLTQGLRRPQATPNLGREPYAEFCDSLKAGFLSSGGPQCRKSPCTVHVLFSGTRL
jgi:hypothetical protein